MTDRSGGCAFPIPAVAGVHPGDPGMSARLDIAARLATNPYLLARIAQAIPNRQELSYAKEWEVLSSELMEFAEALIAAEAERAKRDVEPDAVGEGE